MAKKCPKCSEKLKWYVKYLKYICEGCKKEYTREELKLTHIKKTQEKPLQQKREEDSGLIPSSPPVDNIEILEFGKYYLKIKYKEKLQILTGDSIFEIHKKALSLQEDVSILDSKIKKEVY